MSHTSQILQDSRKQHCDSEVDSTLVAEEDIAGTVTIEHCDGISNKQSGLPKVHASDIRSSDSVVLHFFLQH